MTGPEWLEHLLASVVQVRSGRGGGSAFVVPAEGEGSYLLTNDHVVSGQEEVTLRTSFGDEGAARVLARAPELDLALLSTRVSLPVARVARTGARLGEPVYALGHPWGRPWSLTRGVISGLGRVQLNGRPEAEYLRSDVRLAPGNSGGPLLNLSGEVLGINSMVWPGGLGVAVPIEVARGWLASLGLWPRLLEQAS